MQVNAPIRELYERSDRGTILYIRHAQSIFNLDTYIQKSEKEAKRNKEYLDAKITETGIHQSENLSIQTSKYNVKYVFCSPMLRCLETCFHSLKYHPQKEAIKVIIHPLLTETINCNHDFSRKIIVKKNCFNLNSEVKFDWSIFDFYFPDECTQESFFVDYIDELLEDENVKELLLKIRNPENYRNIELMDNLTTELSAFYSDKKVRPESLKKLFLRNLKFKDFLNSYLNEKGHPNLDIDEKVLVYTHSNFIQTSNSKMAYSLEKIDNFPEDSYKPDNCEVISIFI